MYTIFNCGIGFILSVPRGEVSKVLKFVKDSEVIGEVKKGNNKVQIDSSFSKTQIIL
jgi:phosphoribosylaminoimidazole (AIR) synthetase